MKIQRKQKFLFSSPQGRFNREPMRAINPVNNYNNNNSSASSIGTRATPSHLTSYYCSSPSTNPNSSIKKNESAQRSHGSSTTIYSSSHQSDSLYDGSTQPHSARILTTTMNNRGKQYDSPAYTRKPRASSSVKHVKTNDDDDDIDRQPRQILLPIGGGIVGKLAASATNLSYRKLNIKLITADSIQIFH